MKRKPSQKLADRVAYLESYVSSLAGVTDGLHEVGTRTIGLTQTNDGKFMALYSIVQELAGNEGISTEQFKKHFNMRFEFWYDHVLRQVEDQSPGLAAAIDQRDAVSPDIDTPYPPLFD